MNLVNQEANEELNLVFFAGIVHLVRQYGELHYLELHNPNFGALSQKGTDTGLKTSFIYNWLISFLSMKSKFIQTFSVIPAHTIIPVFFPAIFSHCVPFLLLGFFFRPLLL